MAIGERDQLKLKGGTENVPLVDMVVIVAEVYSAVCQLHLKLWNTTRANEISGWKV